MVAANRPEEGAVAVVPEPCGLEVRHALIEGEQSGVAGPLDMDKIKREARESAGLTPS